MVTLFDLSGHRESLGDLLAGLLRNALSLIQTLLEPAQVGSDFRYDGVCYRYPTWHGVPPSSRFVPIQLSRRPPDQMADRQP
jgi:hypothetical protein